MLIPLTPATRIFVAVAPVDLRRSFDGLAAHVQEVLRQQVIEGALALTGSDPGVLMRSDPPGSRAEGFSFQGDGDG